MITVHHLGLSQSDRIVWLCEELGIDYELKRYERDPVSRAAPATYRVLSPFGTAPVITDGDLTLGESGAIVDYIIDVYGNGRFKLRAGDDGFADYLFWFHFANGTVMPAVMAAALASGIGGATAASRQARLDTAYRMIEARLGSNAYLAGAAFTAADIMNLFPFTTMRVFKPTDLSPFPNILAYLNRIGERPAFRRAMDKAEPGFEVPLT